MLIGFLDFVPSVRCEDALGIRSVGSSDFDEGEKTDLRRLRAIALGLLRSQDAPDSRSLLWRSRIYLEVEIRRVFCRSCGSVKQERLAWISDNPFYTKRFAFYVGRRCRTSTIQDVAKELALDWKTVKALDKQYMQEQLRRIGTPGPRVIGIDEISIRKGHSYRIVAPGNDSCNLGPNGGIGVFPKQKENAIATGTSNPQRA